MGLLFNCIKMLWKILRPLENICQLLGKQKPICEQKSFISAKEFDSKTISN